MSTETREASGPRVRTLNCAICGRVGHVCAVDTLALPVGWGYVPVQGQYVGVCIRCRGAWLGGRHG